LIIAIFKTNCFHFTLDLSLNSLNGERSSFIPLLGPSSRLLFGLRRVLIFDQSFMKSQSFIAIKVKIVNIILMIWILWRFFKFLLISRDRILVSKLLWLLLITRSWLIVMGLRIHSFWFSYRRVSLHWRSLLLNGLLMWLHCLSTVIVTITSLRVMSAPTRHIIRLRRSLLSQGVVVLSILMVEYITQKLLTSYNYHTGVGVVGSSEEICSSLYSSSFIPSLGCSSL
jgi:hypothetical protein